MAATKEVAPKRPAFSSKVGPVEASVWPNNKKDGSLWFSVSFARSYKDSDDTWKRLTQHFSIEQMLDLVYSVGCYETMAMVFNSFKVPFDKDLEPLDPALKARMMAQPSR